MRMLGATICLLVLTGCAHDLPYSIAIGDPTGGQQGMGREQCVLRLDEIVKETAGEYQAAPMTIRDLQITFEKMIHHWTKADGKIKGKDGDTDEDKSKRVTNCTDAEGKSITLDKIKYPRVEEISRKWLTTYALDATDPDQDIDRFREYLRSTQLVQYLATKPLLPDEDPRDTYYEVEHTSRPQSQWCGSVTVPLDQVIPIPYLRPSPAAAEDKKGLAAQFSCLKERSLYHAETNPHDLYAKLLNDTEQVERKAMQRSHRYLVLSYEIPWDKERTLVRYGVTFYFKQDSSKGSTSASDNEKPELIGYDLTYANEATPEQPKRKVAVSNEQKKREWSVWPWSWDEEQWKEIYHVTGWPFSVAIGVKNAAFEVTKLPFSTLAGMLFGRDQSNYPLENLITAKNALSVEVLTLPSWGIEWGWYRLLLELPLIGQAFQYNPGIDHAEQDVETPKPSSKIFLSRGIYGGNKWGQDTGLWALFARASYPDYEVYSPPYRHGTVIDVVWSMFNLSHGPAYSEARYIMDHASPDDRLYLAGHSGGVQRSAAASRILAMHGYRIDKVVGIAGPSVGQAFVDARYPEAFKVYLNRGSGANEDVVSKVGIVAGTYSAALNYALVVPVKYAIGAPLFWVDSIDDTFLFSRRQIYRFFDRVGFSNATVVEVERKPSSRHQTPLRLSFTDRLVFDAYVRNEFATAFKDDLERAGAEGKPKKERPHAFPWEQ